MRRYWHYSPNIIHRVSFIVTSGFLQVYIDLGFIRKILTEKFDYLIKNPLNPAGLYILVQLTIYFLFPVTETCPSFVYCARYRLLNNTWQCLVMRSVSTWISEILWCVFVYVVWSRCVQIYVINPSQLWSPQKEV